jgi:hypothetical protein
VAKLAIDSKRRGAATVVLSILVLMTISLRLIRLLAVP